MKYFFITIVLFLTINSYGQKSPYYLNHQIDSIIKSDSTPFKFQTAAWNYSFIGEYNKSLEMKDLQYSNPTPSKPTAERENYFKNYKPINANSAILKEAAKTRILIINEAHNISLHRIFLTNLLKDLYNLGYTFIGMEALNHLDTLLNVRKFPILTTGFYTKEPSFGNLIRESIETGFTLFPYEQIYEDSFQREVGREKAQAINIKKIIDSNPNAKFVIYCGFAHVYEDTLKNRMGLPMAGQIKRLTGIDPFTIDQTELTEYFIVGNSYRQLIKENYSALFIDSLENYFNKARSFKSVDCNLFHPNTKFTKNRPSWLNRPNTKLVYLQDKIKIDYPYLIKIYLTSDDIISAIPIDIVEIKSKSQRTASLVLKRKKQIAIANNSQGDSQTIKLK